MSEIELKPCPFCGGTKIKIERAPKTASAWHAICSSRDVLCVTILANSRDAAIAKWNTRSQSERVSRLEEALKPFAKLRIREAAWPDDYQVQVYMPVGAESGLTLRDFRRARSALNQGADDGR